MSGHGAAPATPWSGLDAVVEVLAPASSAGRFTAFLDATRAPAPSGAPGRPPGTPFSAARVDALQALSAAFLADPLLRQDPASVAAAYWMRRTQVTQMKSAFEQRTQGEPTVVRVPVGRVFHVAPANVDTLFIYSWALAFLCGNASVVRLSRDRGPIVAAMLNVIDRTAREHTELAESNRFVTYEHDTVATSAISAWCSHRVIWGGNETAAALHALPLNPHASERVFGSKFSYSLFAAAGYLAASEDVQKRVASSFFNDMFWFDQLACSSPQVVFWVGDEAGWRSAIEKFEDALQIEVDRRGLVTAPETAVERRAFAFGLAAGADVEVKLQRPGFVGVRVHDHTGLTRESCGGGLLRHYRLDRPEDIVGFAGESDQTVTHFGFAPEVLMALAAGLGARGVDRLVPVGEALAFDAVWDGYDLLDDFTRRVRVKPA